MRERTWHALPVSEGASTATVNTAVPYFQAGIERWGAVGQGGGTFSNITSKPQYSGENAVRGPGDVVWRITDALGVSHCGECEARRSRWNRIWESAWDDPLRAGWEWWRGRGATYGGDTPT